MSEGNTTLVTSVTVRTPGEVLHRRNVPVRVEDNGRYTMVWVTLTDLGVDIRLTQGEVIALIEALGGKVS